MALEVFASGVATVTSERGRLALPADVVRAWKLGERPEDAFLTVEIVAVGHLRMYRRGSIAGRIEEEKQAAEQGLGDEVERRLRIHQDRYRQAAFNRLDKNRVALNQELVLALIGQSKKEKVYVEAGPSFIDVMTNEVRFQRFAEE